MKRWIALLATAILAAGLAPIASAVPREAARKPDAVRRVPGKKSVASAVYVCKECNVAFTPGQAKRMDYKCPKGHRLFKVAKCPPGCKMMPEKPTKWHMTPRKGEKPMQGHMTPRKGEMPMKGRMAPGKGQMPMKDRMAPPKGEKPMKGRMAPGKGKKPAKGTEPPSPM